jgi:transposase
MTNRRADDQPEKDAGMIEALRCERDALALTSREQAATIAALQERLQNQPALERKIENLQERLSLLQAFLYGRSSERCKGQDTPGQPTLPFDEAESTSPEVVDPEPEPSCAIAGHVRRRPGRRPLPPDLPRVEVTCDLPDADKVCACGATMTRFGEETSERIDVVPPKVQVVRTIRPKYACRSCEGSASNEGAVRIAPPPPHIIPHGLATAGTLAHVIVAKYADALPLYRQEQQFQRLGVDIGRGTFCSWVLLVAAACRMLFELLLEEARRGVVLSLDETPVQVLGEPGRANTTKSYMWVCRGGLQGKPVVVFLYYPGRGRVMADEILADYEGFVQTDGYVVYDKVGERKGVRHLGCLAHVRRKFMDVVKGSGKCDPGVAKTVIDIIREIYLVERQAEAQQLAPEGIAALRDKAARPLWKKFKEILAERGPTTPPKSLLGRAIGYALGQWERLLVYLEDGRLRPDNNLAENAIRPFAVGRKNWLFSASPRGADASAGLYSLIETAKANGIEPYRYLRALFHRLPLATTREEQRALLPQHIDRRLLTGD